MIGTILTVCGGIVMLFWVAILLIFVANDFFDISCLIHTDEWIIPVSRCVFLVTALYIFASCVYLVIQLIL